MYSDVLINIIDRRGQYKSKGTERRETERAAVRTESGAVRIAVQHHNKLATNGLAICKAKWLAGIV